MGKVLSARPGAASSGADSTPLVLRPIANFSSLQCSPFGDAIAAPRAHDPRRAEPLGDGHSGRRAARGLASAAPLAITLALLLVAAPAKAEPLPLRASVRLGHPTIVHVVAGEADTHVRAEAGRRVAEASVPIALDEASVETVDASTGPAAVVRGSGGGRQYVWVVIERAGAPAIVWSGRTDLHGDPGERTAEVLDLTDRTGDGRPDVVVGTMREGFRGCDGQLLLLAPASLDRTGTLRPVTLARPGGAAIELAASSTSPGPSAPPLAGVLRMSVETSALGVDDALSLRAPAALVDGDAATAWVEGRGGAGEGETVVGRVDSPRAIRSIALVRATGEGVVPPRAVLLAGDGALYRVTLPEAFERAWITLPAPASWTCLSLAVDQGPGDDAALHVGIGEIEVYTELDFGGGIATLIEALVSEGADAERTADWLARAGAPALEALGASWDRLSALGHRRAVRVAAAHPAEAAALSLLERAALADDTDVRADAIAVLVRAGAPGASVLVAAASAAEGEPAASALGARPTTSRRCSWRSAAPEESGTAGVSGARPAGALARDDHAAADAAVEAFRGQASPGALAALALGAAEARPELARDLIAQARASATEFEDRWRLVSAARHATASTENDAWLAEVATGASEWMLRDAAITALALRSPEALAQGLADPSPRVRRSAVATIAQDPAATPRLVDRATHDPWPLVRVAALEALAGRSEELEVLRGRLTDRSPMVRERAIQILTERRDAQTWALLAPIFADDDEWPRVTAAALDHASALCVPDATPQIEAVMGRGLREGAWAPHVDVAVQALRVALRLGGESAETARILAARATSDAFAPLLEGQGTLPACPAPLP